MIQQMSSREKVLAILVGAIAFIFLNFIVVEYFVKNQQRLKGDLARNQGALAAMKMQLAEQPLWEERDAWLKANLPEMGDEVRTGGDLLAEVTQLAKKKSVQLVNQSFGGATYQPGHSSVSVNIEATSTWKDLIGFMHEIQAPGKFLVFENATFKKDDKDETQMRFVLKIARWYAPKAKAR